MAFFSYNPIKPLSNYMSAQLLRRGEERMFDSLFQKYITFLKAKK
jgi:hypothetical protein